MEKKNNIGLVVVIVILSICVVGLSCYVVYDKVLSRPSEKELSNKIENNKDNGTNNNEDAVEIPKESEEYFESYLKPYKYIPNDYYDANNLTDEYIADFILNYYVLYDKTYAENAIRGESDTIKCDSFKIPKTVVTQTIENLTGIKNTELGNYSYETVEIKNDGDYYTILYAPIGFDLYDEKIISVEYEEDSVKVDYELIHPYTQEQLGTKTVELNYKNDKFNVVKITYNIYDNKDSLSLGFNFE